MSAIAGFIGSCALETRRAACQKILSALSEFGRDGHAVAEIDQACFGRALTLILPEDDYDRQPLEGAGGRFLLVADIRIDNRDEIGHALRVPPSEARKTSDAGLFTAAWEKWGIACVERLLGDFAFAVWDKRDKALTLGRGPLSTKPLFYHHHDQFVAFATMPQALHRLPEIPRAINTDEAVAIAAGAASNGSATIFAGVSRVRQGQAIEIREGRERVIPLWTLERSRLKTRSFDESAEALRSELDRSVAAQLRRRGGSVAAQLSSGRDSSAVVTSAALALEAVGEKLLAFTSAPREGFRDGGDDSYLCDESELARLTASSRPNIEHFICRPDGAPWAAEMTRLQNLHFGPMLNPTNYPWWNQINRQAAARGATILLNGSVGNFSISAGGSQYLTDLWAENGLRSWWDGARRLAGRSPARWRNAANVSFARLIPPGPYSLLLASAGRRLSHRLEMPLLRPPFRRQAEALLAERFRDRRPPASYFQFRREMLFWVDHAEKSPLAAWGIDVRDPTADRRLVELCIAIPAEHLLSEPTRRPLFEKAFSGRIPDQVLHNRRKGYQTADWFEIFRPDMIAEAYRPARANSIAATIIDFDHMDRLIGAWPRSGWHHEDVIDLYRNKLIGTLALARFIEAHFPNE